MYTDSIGNIFVYWSNSNADFRIVCAKGIFDFFVDDQGRYLTRCKVGFYDKTGHMIEDKTVLMRVVPGNAGQAEMYFPMGDFGANKRKAKKTCTMMDISVSLPNCMVEAISIWKYHALGNSNICLRNT